MKQKQNKKSSCKENAMLWLDLSAAMEGLAE